jgi:hypothetical protein
MRTTLYTFALVVGLCTGFGPARAEEVILGQVAYSRIDLVAKKENRGIWTFTQNRTTSEVEIIKLVIGSAFEIERITPWTRVSVLKGVHLKESFAYPISETRSDGKNFGHIEATDPDTGKVFYRWPMFCTTQKGIILHKTECKAHMDDGGVYEITRSFVPEEVLRTLIEHRRVTGKDGTVISDVKDVMK